MHQLCQNGSHQRNQYSEERKGHDGFFRSATKVIENNAAGDEEEKHSVDNGGVQAEGILHGERILRHEVGVVLYRPLITPEGGCCLPEGLNYCNSTDIFRGGIADVLPRFLHLSDKTAALTL